MKAWVWLLVIATASTFTLASSAAPGPDRRQVLLIAGEASHGPGEHEFPRGCELLAEALNQSHLPLEAKVSLGWPEDDKAVEQAHVLVLFSDGLDSHVARGKAAVLQRRLAAGRGLVVLHFALEPPEGDEALRAVLLEALGGVFEAGWSVNPVWDLDASPEPNHPIARGVTRIALADEWYYHLRFDPRANVEPVLFGRPGVDTLGVDGPRSGNPAVRAALASREPQRVAWTNEAATGARGFGFTGGHFHRNWYDHSFRTLILNAVVWTAGLEVPGSGVPSDTPTSPVYETIERAIARGDAADVQRHLQQDPSSLHGNANGRLTPLHQAILRRQTEIAELLIKQGANINQPDSSQRTPLHLAVIRDDLQLVQNLTTRGARLMERDQQGWTPLHHAAARKQVAIARVLLESGTDPNTLSALGGTALHEAAAAGAIEVARLLLAAGTNPATRSKTGETALEIARNYQQLAVAELLEAAGKR